MDIITACLLHQDTVRIKLNKSCVWLHNYLGASHDFILANSIEVDTLDIKYIDPGTIPTVQRDPI